MAMGRTTEAEGARRRWSSSRGEFLGMVSADARPDGTVYIAGENGVPSRAPPSCKGTPNHLPSDPAEVEGMVDPTLVRRLIRSAGRISDAMRVTHGAKLITAQVSCPLSSLDPLTGQLCYRPTTPDGTPLIGPLTTEGDIFIAAGHGPWVRLAHPSRGSLQGITLGPGTGKVVAELMVGEKPSVPVGAFDPTRFGRPG